jgi:hypothetical protein
MFVLPLTHYQENELSYVLIPSLSRQEGIDELREFLEIRVQPYEV